MGILRAHTGAIGCIGLNCSEVYSVYGNVNPCIDLHSLT